MLRANKVYRQEIEKVPFRNRSYMTVTIGAINHAAQENVSVSSATSPLSNNSMLFDSYIPEIRYATYEQNWWRADGGMVFPPEDEAVIYNQGLISMRVVGNNTGWVNLVFATSYDIRGLTITFAPDAYPTAFTVSNGTVTHSYTNNSRFFTTTDIYDDTSYLRITPTAMSGGTQRTHIEQMYMGVGISYGNKDIISVDKTETVSPISETLPSLDLSVAIQNYDGVWDVNNSASSINYLESGQEVSIRYGYELDDGSIYWMDGGSALLTTWSADSERMTFDATDVFATLTDSYYGGRYYYNGITLYDLAVLVLTDAGVDPRKYILDEYLRDVTVHNPLPVATHAECLQMIANAGRCRMRTDRSDGSIIIEFAAELEINPERMVIEAEDKTVFSDVDAVINNARKVDYAMYSLNYWTADGSMIFIPEEAAYQTAGYVSESIAMGHAIYPSTTRLPSAELYPTAEDAGGYGTFDVNPTVRITLEASYTFYALTVNFSANPPGEMILHSYLNDVLQESYTVYDLELENFIEHDFPEMDSLIIEFVTAPVYNHIYLESVQFGEQTNFSFSKTNMTANPVGTRDEKVKELQVIKTIYSEGTEYQQIISDTVDLTGVDEYTFYLSQASHGLSGLMDGVTNLTITDSSAFYVTFNTAAYSGEHEIAVSGFSYNTAQSIYTEQINTTGTTPQWTNPLISDDTNASLVGEWIAHHLKNNVEYEVQYRGEPRLDAGDLAYFENDYVDGLMVRIGSHAVSFNGALSGSAVCRLARSG